MQSLSESSGVRQMKKRNVAFGIGLSTLLFFAFLKAPASHPLPLRKVEPQCGAISQGLQMSVSEIAQVKTSRPIFEVAFRNVGERDITLNLGMMLANGKVQLPTQVRLVLTNAKKEKRNLRFADPAVAGRIDDYIVPLRAGSTYSLRLRLDDFWSPDTKEFRMKLAPGTYKIAATFEGSGTKFLNGDTSGLALMNFWKGNLQSNTLTFKTP